MNFLKVFLEKTRSKNLESKLIFYLFHCKKTKKIKYLESL